MDAPDGQHDRLVVGVMTGTSLDGVDAALVRVSGRGVAMRGELVHHHAATLGSAAAVLRQMAAGEPVTAHHAAEAMWRFGEWHADVVAELLAGSSVGDAPAAPDLIAVHGQTVYHAPPLSWQVINAAPIAQRLRCPVVSGLRDADLAAGGEGAPITPLADWILLRRVQRSRAIVNLGGFCNVTFLPAGDDGEAALDAIHGRDVCACNQVLDAVARLAWGEPFDHDGAHAARGRPDEHAVAELLAIFRKAGASRRSLGSSEPAIQWADRRHHELLGETLAASAVEAVGRFIAQVVNEFSADEIVVSGGGGQNAALLTVLRREVSAPVVLSDALGVPLAAREAMAMAVLGALCADGVPITLPQVTGCASPAPVAGVWCGIDRA